MYSSVFVKQCDYTSLEEYNNTAKYFFTYIKPDIDRTFHLLKPVTDDIIKEAVLYVKFDKKKKISKTLLNDVESYLQIFFNPFKHTGHSL